MAYQESIMTTKRELIREVGSILKTDLDFLYKLAPRELGILATCLKNLAEQKERYVLIDYGRRSMDF